MKKFSLFEIKIISIIFLCLFIVSGFNISLSLRRGRDSIRKNDISALQNSLDTYLQKYKTFPDSSADGRIVGCFSGEVHLDPISKAPNNAEACNWGESYFEGVNYMPRDPSYQKGMSYRYISDGDHYQIYVSLEGKNEAEYSPTVVLKNLQCGNKICNYGKED